MNNGVMGFSDNLRAFRKSAKLTQEQLALACGFAGQSRIANYESGIREPTFAEADALAKVLRVSRADLMGDPAQSQSHATRPDPVILAESIAALLMVAKRRQWDYDPVRHADATCDAYELYALLPANPSTADVIDFGQKVAERLAREFGNGSEGRPGAGAPIGGNDRGKLGARAGTRASRTQVGKG